jgi:hypothetical protein
MSSSPSQGSGSLILAEEYFGAEDPSFLKAIREVSASAALAGFVDRWKRDPRPFARAQIFAYLAEPLNCIGHNVVVKRLFKHAEEAGDNELMAAFLAAFDVSVRRVRKTRQHYDWQTRSIWSEEILVTPRDTLPLLKARNPLTGAINPLRARIPKNGRLFSYRTRNYLRRRAWRYFRKLGFQHPDRYVAAIARALSAYKDDDLAKGEHILDSWGLVHACFHHHPALEFSASRIRLVEGRGIDELAPAPRFAALWRTPEAAKTLFSLITQAPSRLVRLWAMELLQKDHAEFLSAIDVQELFQLLEQPDEEVQQFGARLLEASEAMAKLSVFTWFELLSTQNALALEAVCRAMQRHVDGNRLTLADCIRLACDAPAPVARMGFNFLKARQITSPEDRKLLASVADARCLAVAGELAVWALTIFGTVENYDRESVLRFFDSHSPPMRQAAWQWLLGADQAAAGATRQAKHSSPGYADPGLWCRLLETPYDDLRLPLIDELSRRASLPGASANDLTPIWCSVLLGVHRGGRQKLKATHQIAQALMDDPARAEKLLPVLVAAVRSIRPTEVRAGLAAVMAAVAARPEIGPLVRQHLPELGWEAA